MYSYLAIPLTVIFGSFAAAAAAPSFQHGRISVDVTHTNVQDQADKYNLPCSSGKKAVIISEDEPRLSSLPFNFTLFARNLQGTETLPGGLPVGFADLTLADGHARLELGYETEFALRDGKLINGNRGIEYHVAKVLPPWLSLWSFDKRHTYLQFAAYPNPLEEGGDQYLLKLTATRKLTYGPTYRNLLFLER